MSVQTIVVENPPKCRNTNLAIEVADAWAARCRELALWTLKRVVVRPDAFAQYYRKDDGTSAISKIDQPVDADLLALHYAGDSTKHVIGMYTTSLGDGCKVLRLDTDQHSEDDPATHKINLAFALEILRSLEDLGFKPLLSHSDGKGSFWLDVFFNQPIPAHDVRAFGAWLVRDWKEHGLAITPEIFPKQDSIDGKYGNQFRLYGRHHKRPWYTEVWNGKTWMRGDNAIDMILAHQGDSFDLVPAEVHLPPRPVQRPVNRQDAEEPAGKLETEWWKRYSGNLRTLDIVALCESKGWAVSQKGDRSFEIECPWAGEHTTGSSAAGIQAADEDESLFPTFHCFHHHCERRGLREFLDLFTLAEVNSHCGKKFGNQPRANVEDERPVITPDQPLKVAQALCQQRYSQGEDKTLAHHRGMWWTWTGKRYEELTEDDLRTAIYKWLDACSHWSKPKKSDEPKLLPFHPTRSIVTGVADALKAVVNLPGTVEMPSWMGKNGPGGVVAFKNGLLDLEAYQRIGKAKLLPHSPRWFSTNCLPHEYDEKATCPRWLEFLDQVFEGDQERKQALAMWFGYCLTSETRQQKFALLVGPPRSGKGTTMAVLGQILGQDNIASPSLTSMGSRFGLAPLIGKQAAIIGDGHLGRQSDSIAILERLKSIVGGDPQNIDRKGALELANVQIKARFTISVNELPRLPDASAALRSRILLIPFNQTYEGKEDLGLLDRLRLEVPGITNWALAGLRRLQEVGRLIQPKAGQELLDDFVRLSSPIHGFVEDCCEVGGDYLVPTSDLHDAWKWWCAENGHEAGSKNTFIIKLRSAARVERKRPRTGLSRTQVPHYSGIRFNADTLERVSNLKKGLYLVP